MKDIQLKGKKREDLKKKIKKQRNQGLIPGVVYGPNRKSTNIYLDKNDFNNVFSKAEFVHLVDFSFEGEEKKSKVLIREVQLPPLGGDPLHVALFEIDANKKIVVSIPVTFTGESRAVKDNIGILVTPVSELPVRCLATDIPDHLQVDISELNDIGNSIKISDNKLPEGVEWDSSLITTNLVADIVPPQKEEVEEVAAPAEGEEGEAAEGEEGEAQAEGEEGEKKEGEGGEEKKPEGGKEEGGKGAKSQEGKQK